MAKMHKLELYFVDIFSEEDNIKERLYELGFRLNGFSIIGKIESSKEFEWDEDSIINDTRCTPEQAEEYFENIKKENK